ncbi:hypothetical protein [Streptomyces shenzhenensis]|uniref:hypothetical protein n=1 Tax=Streptomyces shenzhenensis TaxID=943815 RepID=UPI00340DA07E
MHEVTQHQVAGIDARLKLSMLLAAQGVPAASEADDLVALPGAGAFVREAVLSHAHPDTTERRRVLKVLARSAV